MVLGIDICWLAGIYQETKVAPNVIGILPGEEEKTIVVISLVIMIESSTRSGSLQFRFSLVLVRCTAIVRIIIIICLKTWQ